MVYTSKRFYEGLPFFKVPQSGKIRIYVSFFCLSGIGTLTIKARFDIFYFQILQNFNFPCILGGKGTRTLRNNGQQFVRDNFIHLVNDEVNSGLKLIPKLTLEHVVHLTPYFVMNVSFVVQVLSSTVAYVLRNYYGKETHGTAELCEYMDTFLTF